jgi:dethiobiotin synthetase
LYNLKQPLAPAVAAEIEKVKIDVRRIIERCRQLKDQSDVFIVEGVGGVMVPIRWDYLVLDLIKELKLPTVIVARAGLGTINHTVLTYNALKAGGVEVFGIALNGYPASPGIAEETNPEAVKRMTGYARVFVLPQCEGESASAVAQALTPFVRALF